MKKNRFPFKASASILDFKSGKKHTFAFVTFIFFSLFTISCNTTKLVKVDPGADYENKKVIGFIKRTLEEVNLPKGRPGMIRNNVIETQGKTQKQLEIKLSDVKSKESDVDSEFKYKIITFDGKTYRPNSFIQKDDKLILTFTVFEPVFIPLADVLLLKMKRFSAGKSLLTVLSAPLAIIAAASVLLFGIVLITVHY